jgi:hypothetical protein
MQSACPVLYSPLWPVRLYHSFSHYPLKGMILGKKVTKHKMCVLIFSTTLPETFLIVRRIQRDILVNILRSSCKLPVILVRFLMKFEFSRQIFEKYLNIKFPENPSSESRDIPCGRTDTQTDRPTDRHDDANSRSSRTYERAKQQRSLLAWISSCKSIWFPSILSKPLNQ